LKNCKNDIIYYNNQIPKYYDKTEIINTLSSLKIKKNIIDEVKKFSKEHNIENRIGFHIRKTDFLPKVDDKIIFDRSPIDCLVYSLWAFEKQSSDIDAEFINKIVPLVRESMHFLDIIFFIPKTKLSPVEIVGDKLRETDPVYIEEIDNIFKALMYQYHSNFNKTQFFPKDDCPAIIEIFGNREERIHLIRQYLNTDGNIIGEEADTILNPQNLSDIENLLQEQQNANQSEKFEKQQLQMLKEFVKNTKTS
jgi:hypothetical protein